MKKMKKKHRNNIARAFRLSFSNMWRNKYLTAATVLVMGILIFIFNIILSVNYVTQEALNDLTRKVDIVVYLKDDTQYYQVQQMIKELKALDGIVNATYTSKTDALKIVSQTRPKTAEFLSKYGVDNPLPASLNITTEITVEAWVKTTEDDNGRIVSKHGPDQYGWMLTRAGSSDAIEWRISTTGSDWNGGVTTANSFETNEWYYIASTYDGNYMHVYTNGTENTGQDFPHSLTGNISTVNQSAKIGIDNYHIGGISSYYFSPFLNY